MLKNRYKSATFLKSAARVAQLPDDVGYEIAFAGRSNAGKSTLLNCLAIQKRLARTSKTPGRTQLINLFSLDEHRRLIDLPGYGYAEVPKKIKEEWQRTLTQYLQTRACLRGVILLMDCRHPMQPLDQLMVDNLLERQLPIHIVLTKSDKLSKGQMKSGLLQLQQYFQNASDWVTIQSFSSLSKQGLDELVQQLDHWFEWDESEIA